MTESQCIAAISPLRQCLLDDMGGRFAADPRHLGARIGITAVLHR